MTFVAVVFGDPPRPARSRRRRRDRRTAGPQHARLCRRGADAARPPPPGWRARSRWTPTRSGSAGISSGSSRSSLPKIGLGLATFPGKPWARLPVPGRVRWLCLAKELRTERRGFRSGGVGAFADQAAFGASILGLVDAADRPCTGRDLCRIADLRRPDRCDRRVSSDSSRSSSPFSSARSPRKCPETINAFLWARQGKERLALAKYQRRHDDPSDGT